MFAAFGIISLFVLAAVVPRPSYTHEAPELWSLQMYD